MIGQIIESRPQLPLGGSLWLLLAVGLDVLAVVQANAHLAVASVFAWFVGVLLWRIRERPFTARFTEAALHVDEPPLEVPYADLQGLLAPRRPANPFQAGPRSYLIQVIHSSGVLRIPARLDVPSDEVFSFLYRQFSPSGSRQVPSKLMDFLRHRERRFGPEQVWTYKARLHLGRSKRHPRLKAFFLALLLAAPFWIALGIVQNQHGWIGCGVCGLFFGGLLTLLFWLEGRQGLVGVRGWRQAGLVVAPDGLALVQGDLVGELRWDEVRNVNVGKATSGFEFTAADQPLHGIVLKVEGAVIVIADVYDRPLALIYQNIRYYWKGQAHEDDGDHEAVPLPSIEGVKPPTQCRAP